MSNDRGRFLPTPGPVYSQATASAPVLALYLRGKMEAGRWAFLILQATAANPLILQAWADRSTQGWQQTVGCGAKGREVSLSPKPPWPTASINPQGTGDPQGIITSSTVDALSAWVAGGQEPCRGA